IVHLIFLCANALKSLTFDQYIRFREGAELLIEEDGKLSLFEFNLKYLVFYPLDIAFGLRQEPKIAYFDIASIATETSIALSATIYDQYQDDGKAQEAFEKISEISNVLAYIPSERILNQTLDRAYNAIQQADEGTKRRIIDWALKCVQSDKVTSAGEIETIHALRSALGLGYL
ncbi:MAG: hypothetical protein LBF86_05005, partial [Helicobacteraceae bacterium]|nr:hypothetical protein [Helicobacteraceae bacterium]